jgi:starch phosphorylase
MIRIHLRRGNNLTDFHETFAVQLNDTHPSIGVAELMRLLVDEHQMSWDAAWAITEKTFAYTNHTLLPEALEKWPISLFGSLLPRHLEIIYEINRRFLDQVRLKFPDDAARIRRMSLIDESGERYVRMAYLAFHLIERFESTVKRSGMPSRSKWNWKPMFRATPLENRNTKSVLS